MPALFISYRRSDSSDITGRIFDRLVGHFGSKPVKVVRDVDSIPYGEDFREVLRDKIQDCDVVLVIIGPTWTTVKDHKGTRRLDDAADTVRIEIEQALELKKKVIPVCVTHTQMPTEEDLPEALKKLAFRNGVQVRPDPDFNNDISRLLGALDKIFKDKQIAEAKPPTLPPPQRQFHLPEPPPPPFVDTRHSSGSHGMGKGPVAGPASGATPSTIGNSPFATPQSPPISAEAVDQGPSLPQPKTDSSSGTWPRPGSTSSSIIQPPPPTPHPSHVHPPASRQPGHSAGLFTSATGVALALTALVSICTCGGLFVYFCMSVAGQEYQAQLRTNIQNHPAVIEHLGEIVSIKWDSLSTQAPRGPNGEAGELFRVVGTKASANVYGYRDSVSGIVGNKLRLDSGTEISLRDSYSSGGYSSGGGFNLVPIAPPPEPVPPVLEPIAPALEPIPPALDPIPPALEPIAPTEEPKGLLEPAK